jgi:hypothetical protein
VDIAAHQTGVTRGGGGVKTLRLRAKLRKHVFCIVGLWSARGRVSLQQTGCACVVGDFIRHVLLALHARWQVRTAVVHLFVEVDGDGQEAVAKVSARSMNFLKLQLKRDMQIYLQLD